MSAKRTRRSRARLRGALAGTRRPRSILGVAAILSASALVLGSGCKIERVGEIEWEAPAQMRSRLPDLPAIPGLNVSEESLESVVRDELARMRGVDDPLELVRSRVEELGLAPAGRAGGWYFPVEVERVSTVKATLSIRSPIVAPAVQPSESPTAPTAPTLGKAKPLLAAHLRRRKSGEWSQEARLVKVGYGLRVASAGWDDYAKVDVAGAIAVVDWGAPAQLASAVGWNDRERIERKLEAALAAGAVGCVVRVPELELARVSALMPISVDTARKRDEPSLPSLEFEALISEAVEVPVGARAKVAIETLSQWDTYRLLLARVVGSEQAERNVTIIVEPEPDERELAIYEASSIAALARQLHSYSRRGVRLRRSVTIAVLPIGAPADEMARALLAYGPLPPQNMSAAIVLRDFVGAAASHQVRVFGADGSDLYSRVEQVGQPLGWTFSAVAGEDGQRAFLAAGVPTLSLARSGDTVPADASHWAESLVAETRFLLRIVLRLAREAAPLRLKGEIVEAAAGSQAEPESSPAPTPSESTAITPDAALPTEPGPTP